MKKLFLLVLPAFVLIAIVFSIQSRDFNFQTLLTTISSWQFNNAIRELQEIGTKFSSIGSSWTSFEFGYNIFDNIFNIISAIGTTIVNFFGAIGQIFIFIGTFAVDLFNNITNIFNYLFRTNLHIYID